MNQQENQQHENESIMKLLDGMTNKHYTSKAEAFADLGNAIVYGLAQHHNHFRNPIFSKNKYAPSDGVMKSGTTGVVFEIKTKQREKLIPSNITDKHMKFHTKTGELIGYYALDLPKIKELICDCQKFGWEPLILVYIRDDNALYKCNFNDVISYKKQTGKECPKQIITSNKNEDTNKKKESDLVFISKYFFTDAFDDGTHPIIKNQTMKWKILNWAYDKWGKIKEQPQHAIK